MAKVERQFSRGTAAVVAEEGFDEVFRPHAVSRPRPLSSIAEAGPARPEIHDEDLDLPALRTRRRVPVKQGRIPAGRLGRILVFGAVALVFALLIVAGLAVHRFFMTDGRFRIGTASSIQVLGNSQVTRPELLSVFGGDIGRNIFHVPLAARRAELEQLPWVEQATVMRLLPNQLRIAVVERVPVAFVRAGNHIGLVDRRGVLLDMPPAMMAAKHYSFPVVTGVTATQSAEDRATRMRLYADFMSAITAATAQLSEVDLSDPEDVRVLLPSAGSDLLVHFGSDDFAARWQRLEQKLPTWRQQYPKLAGVDLRYQRQTVLEMAKAPADDSAVPPPVPKAAAPATHTASPLRHAASAHKLPVQSSKNAAAHGPAHPAKPHRGSRG